MAGRGRHRPEPQATRRAWTATDPLPPALLIGAVLLLDVFLVAGVGLAVSELPDFSGRPAPALVALATLICAAVAGALGAYGHPALFGSRRASARLVAGLGTAIGALELAAHALGSAEALPLGPSLLWFAVGSPLLLVGRTAASLALRAAADRTRQRAVLVGDGPQAARFADAMQARQDRSLRILGLVDDRPFEAVDAERGESGLPRIGSMQTLCAMIRRGEVDQVIFTFPWASEERLLRLQTMLADYPVDLRLAPGPRRLPRRCRNRAGSGQAAAPPSRGPADARLGRRGEGGSRTTSWRSARSPSPRCRWP